MKFDGFENEHKSILTVWILNLILPGLGLGTMYAWGSACLPLLIAVWSYQLLAWNIHVAIQSYIFLSVAGTAAALVNNVRFEERQRQALKALQSRDDQPQAAIARAETRPVESSALDTLERKVREAEKILSQKKEETGFDEGDILKLSKPSALEALWTDDSLKEQGAVAEDKRSPSDIPYRFDPVAATSNTNREDHDETSHSAPAPISLQWQAQTELPDPESLPNSDGTAPITVETGQPAIGSLKGIEPDQPPQGQFQSARSKVEDESEEPFETVFSARSEPTSQPIPHPDTVDVGGSHSAESKAPLVADSLELVSSGKVELPAAASPLPEPPPTKVSEAQVQGFMQNLGDTIGTSYQQTPFPQPSFDFSYQRFEAPNFTFDFTKALEESQPTTTSTPKQPSAKGNCPHCDSPKHPEFSFCLRCGVSF